MGNVLRVVAAAILDREKVLGVRLVWSESLALVRDQAALERTPMEMHVYLARVEGAVEPRSEIAAVAWAGARGPGSGTLAPAIENHVLPLLAARGLIA